MSDENGAPGTNLLLFLLGAVVGAAVVALVTPKSGPDLREEIKDLADKLKRKTRNSGIALRSVWASENQSKREEPGA
jgi:gas vesicle protein